ncbi:MAG: hypothetical protein KBC30_02960 [Planctomycetes bacterium]|nr:hypothetical protein [Planctomycetota bacterium]
MLGGGKGAVGRESYSGEGKLLWGGNFARGRLLWGGILLWDLLWGGCSGEGKLLWGGKVALGR